MRFLFTPWGLILQGLALIHFIRRRPDMYWLWIIIFLGPLGAGVYILMEVIPDLGVLRQSFDAFPRRKSYWSSRTSKVFCQPSIKLLETSLKSGLAVSRFPGLQIACSDEVFLPDAFYRRGIAKIHLGEFAPAVPDLEHVVWCDRKYDSNRAAGLLAHAYANTGEVTKADALFEEVTQRSTLSETYYNYALFLASQGRTAEAREWTQKILAKKPTMPGYLRRRERPWFRRANSLLKRLPATSP